MRRADNPGSRIGILLLAFALASCDLDPLPFSVRARFQAAWASPLQVMVYVEGADGRSLDCANVVALDPASIACPLDYDAAKGCYRATMYAPTSGAYRISVESRVGSASFAVPVSILSSKPDVIALVDGAGNSAFSGAKLRASEPFSCAWTEVPGAKVYIVRIMSASACVFGATSAVPSVLIPANALSPGSYTVSVLAQSLSGDPLLRDAAFCSVSEAAGASVMFETVP